jgi:uncharacterized OB-fold protein
MTYAGSRVWHGTMPVQFLYTPGAAGLRFFQTLKQKGLLTATHCEECAVTYLPPRIYCENCFADLSGTWREVPGRGRVHTYAVVRVDREGRPLPQPDIVAFVRIDGTDGGLITRLVNMTPSDAQIEMPVEMIVQPPRRRRALLSDIVGFAPVGAAAPRVRRRRPTR